MRILDFLWRSYARLMVFLQPPSVGALPEKPASDDGVAYCGENCRECEELETEEDFVRVKLPADLDRFQRPKKNHFYLNFALWAAKRVGLPRGAQLSVDGLHLLPADGRALDRAAKRWYNAELRARGRKATGDRSECDFKMYSLDVSPSSMRHKWAKRGYLYVHKGRFHKKDGL